MGGGALNTANLNFLLPNDLYPLTPTHPHSVCLTRIPTHTHIQSHTHTQSLTLTYTTLTLTPTFTQTHSHTLTQGLSHTFIFATHTHILLHLHTSTNTTHTHTQTQTGKHTGDATRCMQRKQIEFESWEQIMMQFCSRIYIPV